MTDSPFHLSSLCSTPLFGGKDFLGCPVNMCDGNMEITEFLDPGEFSSDDEEAFARAHPASGTQTDRVQLGAGFFHRSDSAGSMSNWPGAQDFDKNRAITEDESATRRSLSSPEITSAVNTNNPYVRKLESDKQPISSPLKGHFSSSKKLHSRNGVNENNEHGKRADDNIASHGYFEDNACVHLDKSGYILRTHDGTVRTSRKKQPEKGWRSSHLVSKQQCLNLVNVRPAWSYKTSRSGRQLDNHHKEDSHETKWNGSCFSGKAKHFQNAYKPKLDSHHKENYETKSLGTCFPRKAKNTQNACLAKVCKNTKRPAGNSLEGDQRSATEAGVRLITAGQTGLWIRPLMKNSVSLPAITSAFCESSIKRDRAKVKLPSLPSTDSLLKYNGKHMKMTGRSRKTSRPKWRISRDRNNVFGWVWFARANLLEFMADLVQLVVSHEVTMQMAFFRKTLACMVDKIVLCLGDDERL